MFIWSLMMKLEPKGFNVETIRCKNDTTLVLYNKKLLEITDLWTGVQKRTDEKSHEVICNCQGCRPSKHAKYVRVNNRKCPRNDAHDSWNISIWFNGPVSIKQWNQQNMSDTVTLWKCVFAIFCPARSSSECTSWKWDLNLRFFSDTIFHASKWYLSLLSL